MTNEPVTFPGWAVHSGIDTALYRHVGTDPITDEYWESATDNAGKLYGYHQDKPDGFARGAVPGEWEVYIVQQGG